MASKRKHQAAPKEASKRPPMAGPMTRAEFTMALFSAMAFTKSFLPTSSTMRVCRDGISKAMDSPQRAEKIIRYAM